MRSTLIYIPYDFLGLPIVGFGWLLLGCIILCACVMGWLIRKQGWNQDTAGYLPFFFMAALVFALFLPNMVEYVPGETEGSRIPIGIPVRGFGIMMMVAMLASVGLAWHRARQMGIDPEEITSLAMWMIFPGIIGARLFFIIQYHKQFFHGTTTETLVSLLDVTKGGLVVYGSVLGGVPFGIYYLIRRGLPVLAVLDIIAPSMVLGAALGRIGCFLNGCCYGGESDWPVAVTFPPKAAWYMKDSPPYEQQHELGLLYGMQIDRNDADRAYVKEVRPGTPAEAAGVIQDDVLTHINGKEVKNFLEARAGLALSERVVELTTSTGDVRVITQKDWPGRSLPIHPTQLYSAVDAGLLALVLWFFYPYRRRDGEVFALLITIHPITRFLLEKIRSDEPGQFNTSLTISQWISLGFVVLAVAFWYYVEKQPPGSALPKANAAA